MGKANVQSPIANFSNAMTKYSPYDCSKKRSSTDESAMLSMLTVLEHTVRRKACHTANLTQTWTRMYPWTI